MDTAQSTRTRMSRAVAWMVLFKIGERGISLVSMTLLARLLVPADFGLIVLATSMIALLELLGSFGLDLALIRQADADRKHFDAVWTFRVLFGFAVAILAASLSPVVAWFYGDPRLVSVMLVLAAARAVGGFENTGIVILRKELQFDREVGFLLAKRLATSLLVTIPLAFALRSYWALVLGSLIGTCIAVALSYLFHPFRPRPSLAGLAELMKFSKWLFVMSLMQFLHSRLADFLIGRLAGATALGSYTVAQEISRVPTGEIAAPLNRAVFPGYVKLADDRSALRNAYSRVASVVLLVVLPAGIGLCLLAKAAVLLLLGATWIAAVPVVQLLALNAILNVMLGTAHHVNLAVGMSRSTSLVLGAHVALSLPLMLWLVPSHGAPGAALALLIASVVVGPLNYLLLNRAIAFGPADALAMLWRPAIGTLVMGAVVIGVRDAVQWPSGVPLQIAHVAALASTGACVYALTVALCWFLHPDPESAEAWIAHRARRALAEATRHVAARLR